MNAIERATGPRHACKSASTSTSELPSIPARLEALNYIGLPAELRLKTIRYTMEEPQNVGIDFFTGTTYEIAKSPPPRRFTPIPIALHLNRESRIEALKHYEVLLFHSIPDNWKSSCPTIYINKAVDTLTVELKPQTDSHSWEEASMLVECIKFIDFPRSRLVVSMSEENDWLSKIRGMESWQLDDKSFREGYDKTCTAIVKKLAVFARELVRPRLRFYCATGKTDDTRFVMNELSADNMSVTMTLLVYHENKVWRFFDCNPIETEILRFEPCEGGIALHLKSNKR